MQGKINLIMIMITINNFMQIEAMSTLDNQGVVSVTQ